MHIFIYACEFLDVAITFNHVFVFIIMRAKQDRSASYIRGYRWPNHNMRTRISDVKEDEQKKREASQETLTFAVSNRVERNTWGEGVHANPWGGDGGHSLAAEHFQICPDTGLIQHQHSPWHLVYN